MVSVRCKVLPGLIASTRTVRVPTMESHDEEVELDQSFVDGDRVVLGVVAGDEASFLVEFPVESASGNWRAWVPKKFCENPRSSAD